MYQYIVYYIIWGALVLFLSFFIRFMVIRMQRTESRDTKNSLFAILMLVGIPTVLVLLIAPIIILGEDRSLSAEYKLLFILLLLLTVILVYYGHKKKKLIKS